MWIGWGKGKDERFKPHSSLGKKRHISCLNILSLYYAIYSFQHILIIVAVGIPRFGEAIAHKHTIASKDGNVDFSDGECGYPI
jgi:hypothetical protein